MKYVLWLMGLILVVSMPVEAADTRYKIVNGKVLAPGRVSDGTLLLEERSGRTWILLQRGTVAPVWYPIPFESTQQLNYQLEPSDAPDQATQGTGNQ